MGGNDARELVRQLMKLTNPNTGRKVTLADIASRAQVSEQSVRMWKTGQRKPYNLTCDCLLLWLSELKKNVK